ncbi:AEC family transporter [Cupriavidus sp. PET2-C1]
MDVVLLTLPMFGIVFAGWFLAATGLVSEKVGDGLSEYVFSLAVPALIIETLTQSGPKSSVYIGYWIAYFGGCAVVWTVLSFSLIRLSRATRGRESIVCGFASSQSNTIFFGVPIILAAFGEAGRVPLFLLLAVHLPLMMAAATLLVEPGDGRPLWLRCTYMAKSLARNPIVVALAIGGLLRAADLAPTGVSKSIVGAFGATASTCALFSLGVSMKRYDVLQGIKGAILIALGKLVLHPLLVWLVAFHVFSMPPAYAGVATLFAAMPVGVNSYLLAARYRAGEAVVSSAIVLSTVISVLTIPFWTRWVVPTQ